MPQKEQDHGAPCDHQRNRRRGGRFYPAPVHRALYGKKGLSEQTRQQILDLCARRGYRANSAASALKRSALRIAAAFPGPQEENSYFYGSVWHGFRRCMAELDDYNLEVWSCPIIPAQSAAKPKR